MCEHCNLLRHLITKSHTKTCPACASPHAGSDTTSTCPKCVVCALLYQNTFDQRWTDIQTAANTTRPAQIYPSLNSPQPMAGAPDPGNRGRPNASVLATGTEPTPPSTHTTVNLALTKHTLDQIHQVLLTNTTSVQCPTIHIPHPTMTLPTTELFQLQGILQSGTDHALSHRLLFHYLHITAQSPLIPRDRSLHLTVDRTTHAMTPPHPSQETPPHRLHLFLNPRGREPYLSHIHT